MIPIFTLTFNPCIDKSTSIPALVPEKKLRCSPPKFEPGGGGINVSRAIKKLGGSSVAIYPAGGYSGRFLNVLLEEEGIEKTVIETARHTRENLIVLETSQNQQFRFGMPGPELQEVEWKQCLQLVEELPEGCFLVASGSITPGLPADIYARISKICRKRNIKLVVDTSGDALRHAVEEGVYLIKPNLGELSALSGVKELKPDDVVRCAQQLISLKKTEAIVVSMGESGAMLITRDTTAQVTSPRVERKSTVGAGDSMVAGLVLSLARGKGFEEALGYGVACGTAATMNPGTELCDRDDVERLFQQIRGK